MKFNFDPKFYYFFVIYLRDERESGWISMIKKKKILVKIDFDHENGWF